MWLYSWKVLRVVWWVAPPLCVQRLALVYTLLNAVFTRESRNCRPHVAKQQRGFIYFGNRQDLFTCTGQPKGFIHLDNRQGLQWSAYTYLHVDTTTVGIVDKIGVYSVESRDAKGNCFHLPVNRSHLPVPFTGKLPVNRLATKSFHD